MSACPPGVVDRPIRSATIGAGAPATNRRFAILPHPRHRPAARRHRPPGLIEHGQSAQLGLARQALSPGRELGWLRGQLRPVLDPRDQGRALPVRRQRPARARAHRAARIYRRGLARLSARGRPGPALRLPRARALRAAPRPPLQPPQAPDRPLRPGPARPAQLDRRPFRLPHRQPARRSVVRPPGQRPRDAQMPRGRPGVHLGRRSPAAGPLARDGGLRGPRARPDRAPSRPAGAAARHLRRARLAADDRLSGQARDHRDRAPAGARLRRRPAPGRAGPAQLLGLQHARLLRPGAALRGRRQRQHRIQDHGQAPAPGRHRGDPGCGLQPHRRRRPDGPDAELPGHRQRQLLPPDPGRRALPHRRDRLRQHGQPQPSARAAAGHGLAPPLGRGHARRRLPVRSRLDARPRGPRLRPGQRLLRCHPPGRGAAHGQADRRALGHRPGRLPAGRLSARLGRVERPLPRQRAPLLAGRRGHAAGARLAADRLERHLRASGPPALGQHQQDHRPRRLHPRGPGLLRPQAQRGQSRGQSGWHRRQLQLEPRPRGAERRSRDHGAARAPEAQPAGDAPGFPRHADAARRRRVRAQPAGQQQRLLPGQRDQLVRLERDRSRRRAADRLRPPADRAAPRPSGAAPAALFAWPRPFAATASRTSPG